MMSKHTRVGRPFKAPQDGERVMLGLRVSAELKRMLDAAAMKSGRSQAQETELRLKQTFDSEALSDKVAARVEKLLDKQTEQLAVIWRQIEEQRVRLLDLIKRSEAEDRDRADYGRHAGQDALKTKEDFPDDDAEPSDDVADPEG